jgi:pimeloyl-ACP methyl ester carboxylesterase
MDVAAHEVRTATLPTGPTVAYTDTGGDSPAVVFGHGFMLDRRMFDAQIEALREDYRVIAWDARGHGDTRDDGGTYTYWDAARDLLALLDHLDIERAVLAGMSQGGFIALRAALLAPARARALILIDSQAGGENPEITPLYEAMHTQWITEGPTDDLARTAVSIILSDDPALLDVWVPRNIARPQEGLTPPFRCLMDRDDITDRLDEITAPALVIHGTADAAIPMDRAEQLAARLRNARPLVRIEGGAHASNVTHPAEVNAAIKEFLATLAA